MEIKILLVLLSIFICFLVFTLWDTLSLFMRMSSVIGMFVNILYLYKMITKNE